MSIKFTDNTLYLKDANGNEFSAAMYGSGANTSMAEIKTYADSQVTSAKTQIDTAKADAEQAITTKATTTIASIPEDYTELTNEVTAISGDLVQFENDIAVVHKSKNLYNPLEDTQGKRCLSTGIIEDNANSFYTGYIPVKQNDVIVISHKNSAGNRQMTTARFVSFYDNAKVYKSGANATNQFLIPNGVSYMILSWNETHNDLMVEVNADGTMTGYEAYFADYFTLKDSALENPYTASDKSIVTSVGDVMTVVEPQNILNMSHLSVGYILSNGNIDSSNTRFSTSDFIQIDVGAIVYAYHRTAKSSGLVSTTGNNFWCAYDENKTMVANSRTQNSATYTVPNRAKYVRYSYNNTMGVQYMLSIGASTKYSDYFDSYNAINGEKVTSKNDKLHIFLPPFIPIANGRTIEIYNNQVCLESQKYHIQWDTTIGIAYENKLSINGQTDGTTTVKFNVYDDNNVLVTSASTNVIVFTPSTSKTASINPIGDSLTDNKIWLGEIERLSNGKLSSVGTSNFTFSIDGNTYTGGHNGVSGYSANNVWNTNATANKYYNSAVSHFDWAYYKATYGINPSAIQIFLGMNGLEYENISTLYYIGLIINNIRETDANIPIFLVFTQYKGDQNGIGGQLNTQGYASASGRYKYGEDLKTFDLMTRLYDTYKESANIYFVPIALTHDSEHNYPTKTVNVNPRSTGTIVIQSESVHPSEVGYMQFADMIYSSIAYQLLR